MPQDEARQPQPHEGSAEQDAPPVATGPGPLPAPVEVARAQFRGLLYGLPPAGSPPAPAVVAVPAPDAPAGSLDGPASQLLSAGMVVLVIDWGEQPRYLESLAILPGAIAYLIAHAGIDPLRLGALGVDVGGDLVLRAASTDSQIRSVLALRPHVTAAAQRHGLAQRLRRPHQREWDEYTRQIAAYAAVRQLAGRQVCVAYGAEDCAVNIEQVAAELDAAGLAGALVRLPTGAHHGLESEPAAGELARSWFTRTL